MTAKEYLQRVRKLDAMIEADMSELEQLEALATKITAMLGDEKVQTSRNKEKMADCTVKIVMMKQKINAEIDELVDLKEEVKQLIFSACESNCVKLLTKRYLGELNEITQKIEYRTWEQIAVDLDLTYQWVSDGLHKKALAAVQKKIDEIYNT